MSVGDPGRPTGSRVADGAGSAAAGLLGRLLSGCSPAQASSQPGRPRIPRRGFTLLELLLASLFAGILLAGLWALLSTYERLFASGQRQTEHAQLVRVVLGRLSEDLRSAIADYAPSVATGPTAVRRFGLFGSSRALQVDVLQIEPDEVLLASAESDSEGETGRGGRTVRQLRTVQWRFQAPGEAGREGRAEWAGLVRRELVWDTPVLERPSGASLRPADRTRRRIRPHSSDAVSAYLTERFEVDPDDPSLLFLPEVTEVAFRYFDGQTWSDQWNSLARKSLPMAVEIHVTVRESSTGPLDSSPPNPPSEAEDPWTLYGDLLGRSARGTYRLLVPLLSTSLTRRSEGEHSAGPAGGLMLRAPAVVAAPPVPPLPLRAEPRRPESIPMPDQWMRTGP